MILTRGLAIDVLAYCLPHEPLWVPLQEARAFPISLRILAERARSQGAELVVYIDLLQSPLSINQAGSSWTLIRQGLMDQFREVDLVMSVEISSSLTQFSSRSQAIEAGNRTGEAFLDWLRERGWF
jgi:hypothetical protein